MEMSVSLLKRLSVLPNVTPTARTIASRPTRTKCIGVARKFTPPADFLSKINDLATRLLFKQEPASSFRDVYYDDETRLFDLGVHCRRRKTAIVPSTPTTSSSTPKSTTECEALFDYKTLGCWAKKYDLPAIEASLRSKLPLIQDFLSNEFKSTSAIIADLKTDRQTWTLSEALPQMRFYLWDDGRLFSSRVSIFLHTITSPTRQPKTNKNKTSTQDGTEPFTHTIGEVQLVLDPKSKHESAFMFALQLYLKWFMDENPSIFLSHSTKEEANADLTTYIEWKRARPTSKP